MSAPTMTDTTRLPREFRHEVLLYEGDAGFLATTTPFIQEGVARGEAVLVVVAARKIALLRDSLGADAGGVHFADMASVGQNPARIIGMWNDFVHPYGRDAGPMRGVGEPVGPERSPAALVECQRHEALLNLAFHDTTDFWLVCPYDISGLDAAVITEAQRAHPIVSDGARERASLLYDPTIAGEPCAIPLPEPGGEFTEVGFTSHALVSLRGIVGRYAIAAGLTRAQAAELVIAVNEVATNSLVHGGGCGTLRMWNDGDSAVCEVRDRGRIEDPLVGRFRPSLGGLGGRGLWLVNQLCDLVQVRTFPDGTTVRMHTTRCR